MKKILVTSMLMFAGFSVAILSQIPNAHAVQIKRVQSGTMAFDADDVINVAALTYDVDMSKSIIYLTTSSVSSTREQNDLYYAYFEDAGAVAIGRGGATVAGNVTWHVVEFNDGVSVQRGLTSMKETITSKVIDLSTSITASNAFPIIYNGGAITTTADTEAFTLRGTLSNSQLTVARVRSASNAGLTKTITIAYQVVEFSTDATIRTNSATIAYNATSTTATLNPAIADTTRAFLLTQYSGGGDASFGIDGIENQLFVRGNITNSTTLTFTRAEAGTDNAQDAITIQWYLIELTDPVSLVQSNTTSFATGAATASGTLGTSTDYSMRVWPIISLSGGTTGSIATDLDEMSWRAIMTTGTNLAFTRETTGAVGNIAWYAVEFAPLKLKIPDGGEVWRVNQTSPTTNITWKHSETQGLDPDGAGAATAHRCNIDLSTNSGSSYPLNIATGVNCTLDTYTWLIPSSISSTNLINANLRVKITDSDMSVRNYDYSNANFEIKGKLTLSAPDGGEAWTVGNANNITWSKDGDLSYSTITVKLSQNSGSSYGTTVTSLLAGNTTSYAWSPLNADEGTSNRVRIELASDTTNVYDESAADFSVRGSITITAPNGSESWPAQTNQDITWTRTGSFANVKIDYSTNSGGTYPTTIVASTAADPAPTDNSGTYTWSSIPVSAVSSFARVKVTSTADTNVSDTSNADFSVVPSLQVTSPNAGTEVWRVGDTNAITWSLNGSIANVKIEYSKDNFATAGVQIVASTPADPAPVDSAGTYNWTNIPDDISSTVRIKVSDASNASRYDISDNDFKIRGKITVTSPNGGEVLTVGSSPLITWTKDGSLGNVDLFYSTNGGSSYPNGLTTGQTGNNWTWTNVPDNINSTVRIKVRSATYSTDTEDTSDANFAIKGSYTITSPNGGEAWGASTSQTITWTKTGTLGNAKLEYSVDGGTDGYANTIIGSTASDTDPPSGADNGQYVWTTPATTGTQFRVKITLLGDATVTDTSNSNFSIRGSVNLTAPNGAESWTVGTNQNITWTYVGSISNMKLELSTNSGSSYLAGGLITGSTPASALSYTWAVPDSIGTTNRVRISDAGDATVNDESNADFTIKGSLTLTAPNGGETWVVGASNNITWTKTGTLPNVSLIYSTNGFSDELSNTTITASTPGANLSYPWTIPDAIGSNLKVRVVYDTTGTALDVSDESNANFGIKGSLTITAPNSGEQWGIATGHDITWTKTGTLSGNLKLELSTDAGSSYLIGNLISNTVPATNSTYNWTVPDAPTTQGRVKVTYLNDTTVNDQSDANFSIKGSLTLTSPNGGQTWIVGENRDITWTKGGSIANVKLDYSTNSGSTFPNAITASTPGANLSYTWTIPDAIGTGVRVRITDVNDGTVTDDSDADFAIKGSVTLTAPNGGETWIVGASQNITWTKTGTVANVKLEYSTNAFATEAETVEIVSSTPGANLSYAWTIPDAIDSSVRVRITNLADATVTDVSNANFAIKGSLTVSSPNGSETWIVGESRNVVWTMTGSLNNVKLEYSTNAFADETQTFTIVNSTAAETNPPAGAGTGQYAWTVADAISTNLKVRVTNVDDATVTDVSNAVFTIKGSLALTSPNGSEIWAVNENRAVTWTRTGSFNNVKLEYSTNSGGSFPNVIVASTAADPAPVDNTGTYTWTIPDNITTNARVRVSNVDDGTVFDDSNANFKIRGGLTVTSPNGSEKWTVTEGRSISWTKTGTITSTVKLEYSTNGFTNETQTSSIATGLNVTSGTPYAWTIPDAVSQTVKVRVTSEADSDTTDTSDANFKIMPKFTISAPNGGEVWSVASSQTILWTTDGSSPNVKLDYSTDGGQAYSNAISASSANAGSYSWTVPDAISTAVRVRVAQTTDATDAFDTSNSNFKIRGVVVVNAPNGGEQWSIAGSQNIQWTRTGSITNVKLEYSSNAFADESATTVILASTPADPAPSDNVGIYAWTIPDTPGTTNRVRVSDASDATVTDLSNANFSIKGSLTLNAPNGSETWVVATVQNIQWTRAGSIANVKLEYSEDSGGTWPGGGLIIASTPADPAPADNIGTYSWTIPDKIGTALRVRVLDAADNSVADTSNADFAIKGSIVVTAPNGGETWFVGDSQNITWTAAGSFLNVKLEYSTNAFADETQVTVISATTPNDGTFSWTIPDAIGSNLKVRATDVDNATVTDVSNAAFAIKGTLTLTSPNGTEIWKVGEARNITWNKTGTISTVKLEYSTNGGSTYPNSITASTNAGTGTYAWTVPDAIGQQVRVKVTHTGDSSVNDASNANFEVKGTVTLTAPNGSEVWAVNTQHSITWTKTGTFATVKLEYSTNAFATEAETTVINTGIDAVTGTPYTWTVPDAIDNTVKIRITNEADAAVTDNSDTNFKIVGSLTLTAPNGGESWSVASSRTVSWTPVGSIANVKLEYSTNSGSTYPNVITASTAAGAGAYSWTIPDSIGSTRRVKVSDASDATVSDESNADFTIMGGFAVTAPNGGEVWTVASGQSVTWTTSGTVADVKLEYSTNGFVNETQTTVIAASTPNTGTHSWTVPNAIATTVKVRVSDASNANAFDVSNGNFKIRGALLVNAPNGGEAWFIGNSQNIQWTRTGSIANVKLEYSSNAFADELQTSLVIASTAADPAPADNVGIYAWTIPDEPGVANKVRVTDASDATVVDTSNANFSIKGQVVMQIPNGGEVWTVGSVQNVQWSKFGAISNVSLQYSTDSGGTWPGANSIVASTAADPAPVDNVGIYSWTIPDAIGTQLRVRVVDAADSSTYDDSNADFKVRGSITMTAPNGGEIWNVGSSQNVTWNSTGSFTNVKLEYSTNAFSDELQTNSITSSTPNDGSFSWTIPDAIGTTLKVRASDVADATVVDLSNGNFTVKGALAVTSPNGTEVWKVGESRNITWNRTGSIANVKIEYSTNGGSSFPNTISASTGAASGTYSWTVPDAIGTQLKVQVSDVTDGSVNDASNANFEIKGTVTVTSPNGGEVWTVASQRSITWTKTGTYATVKLEYSTNGFSDELQNTTIATGVDAVTGTPYTWTVPDTIGTSMKVRISNEADAAVVDVSNLNFKIAGAFALTAPNGGESWGVGTSKTVTWTRTGSIASAKLELSTNSGSTFPTVIVASTGAAAEAYIWTIPDSIGSTRRVKISDASDASIFDTSDADFSIMGSFAVTAPNGGEVWTVSSPQSLTWTTTGTVSDVKLEYSTNAFSNETQTTQITASTPNTGTYSWTVANAISNLVRIRVSDVNNANAFDISNASFKIRGALAVNFPNGGEAWLIGNTENIQWTRTGSIANVKLEFSTNGFSDELQTSVIIASTAADPAPADNVGIYAWTIPDNPGTVTKVRVTDASDATVLDTSNANFSIKGQFVLSIPNGGEIWTVGGVQNVQWTKFGSISNAALFYSTDSGSTWPGANQIVASTAADPAPLDNIGFYSWTIPDQIGTQLRVRVQDAADASTYDDSNADFKIKGAVTVTSPNGGEVWIVGASQNITWTSAGSFSNVKLEYSRNGFSDELQTFSITSSTPNDGTFAWTIPDAIGTAMKVRISDVTDATVVDMSNSNFTVKGALTVTSPNGTEVWKVGEARNITWNRTGSIANVKLEYSTNGGSTYPNLIVASTDAATGTYAWTVPDSIGTQLRVQASDVTDTTVNDGSNANFEIKGTVTLTSPNGGEVWAVGTSQNITWTKTGTYSTIKLEYSTNAFADELQTTVIATGVDAVTGTPYSWTVPDVIGSSLRVRVTNEADAAVTDSSNLNFKIVGSFVLTAPNGGENWAVGTNRTVTWTRTGSIANAKLEYSTDGGTNYPNVIVASTSAAAGAYIWTIPDAIGSNRKVKISDATDATVFDVSNANFTIMGNFAVTAPNGGEVWTVASAQSLTWTTTGTVSDVMLEYSTNAFSNETQTTTISASTPNTGTYSWTVANAISNLVRIRVSDVSNANAFDISNASFKIRGALLVTAPNGGEPWEIGTVQNITWTRTGSIANVKLEYSTNAFADETQTAVITASTPADPAPADNNGTYAWTIPDAPSTTVKLRATDASDATVLDTSNANFTIKGRLVLTTPNGAEVWTVAGVSNIQWSKFGAISNVALYYSTDSGNTWPGGANQIVASTAADPAPIDNIGIYSWTIPDAIGTQVRVRVQDAGDPSTYDDSDADFKIRGAITITSPNGGEVWIVGANQNITWTSAGTYSNAKLEYSRNAFSDELQTFSITAATPNDGSFSWTIPDAIGSTVRVRGSDASDATVNDISNANFTIKGSLTLTSPNGSELWKVGESRNITWNRSGSIANVKLAYSTNGGSSYPNTIIASTDASTGTYSWTVPDAISSQLRVQVSDVTDATVADDSNANFEIKGTVTLTSPNGGEVWTVASHHDITWTKTGTYATVKLEYSTNAFADELQTTVIATGVDSVNGTPYDWTVPDTIGTALRIRVTNESDAAVADTSNLSFKIAGSLTLTAPNGGENWPVGTQKTITWNRVGSIANAKLEYSLNGGTTYPNVISASTGAAAEAFLWTIPDSIGTNRKVKISDASDASVFDVSDANFAILGSFAVTSPNGGEVWTVASAQSITWNTTGTVSDVKLEYSKNAFSDESQTTVIEATTPNTGTYSWTVADAISNLARVRVSDVNNANANDISNASFKIRGALLVTAPNGGEPWEIGTAQNITWTRTGSIANVKLEYSTNGFSDELQTAVIIASTPADPAPADNNGAYSWTIPDTPSTANKIRVTDASDATVLDTSNANFIIKGRLVMSVPNGGEVWTVAGVNNIQWTKFGAISNVTLFYSTDSGQTWPGGNQIVASTAADPAPADNNGFYSWTIPDAIGTTTRVRVQDAADSSTYDDSNADFKIRGAITITAPNGGEVWIVGTNQNITWTSAGSYSNVKLEYSANGFSDELQTFSITSATPNDGSFSWSIPDAIGSTVKVRGSDAADATVNDASNGNFTIKGSLSLTSPNGGEVWKVGENRALTWNKAGSIANVKLEYSNNGGSTYPNIITNSTDANTGSYTWAVADAISAQLRVRVSDVTDSTVNDASDANFEIKGTVLLIAPNGGEQWPVNTAQNITWSKTGTYSTVKLEYSTNAFADELQTTVIATGVDSVTGSPYSWTIPDAIGAAVRVRVTNESDALVTDKSDNNFKIVGSLALTAPNGGENWNVGTSQTVSWTRVGSIANVKLEYSSNGGSTYPNLIVSSTGAGAGAYSWTIPDSIGTNRRVKVTDASDATVFDTSDANFAIVATFNVTQPNGGEVWTVASTQNITWTTTGSVANVKLEYATDGGTDYSNLITNSTPNNLTYSWVIPDSISTLLKIRISDVNNANGFDTSNAVFKIRGALSVDAPNGGEQWGIGTSRNIQWTRTGSIANVKLEYSTNGFSDELQTALIVGSAPADPAPADNTGIYAWSIPDVPSTTVKVRVTDVSDATVLDLSNSIFSIKGSLTITAPNGSENWIVGTPYNITWIKGGAISNVKLQYSTDSGTTWPDPSKVITTSTSAGFLSYTWTIPDDINNKGRVRILDANDNSVNDTSDADFSIKGSLRITSPDGTEIWTVGDTHPITWTKTGTIANVKLEYSTDAGSTWPGLITASTGAAAGSYNWVIPDSISEQVRVKITQTNDAVVADASDANFKIQGSLTVTSPNGGEVWRVANSQPITWTKTGTIPTVKLEYSTNGGATFPNSIATGVDGSSGSYSWTIPNAITTNARVKITNEGDTTVFDSSDTDFKIAGSITVTAPNGGEKWGVGTNQNITWNITGSISSVKLEYSTDGGATYPNTIIGSVDAAAGTPYVWNIPDTPSTQARVKVTNASDPTVFDASNSNFKIQGSINLTAPNGGEAWTVGESRNITWTKTGSFANVKIDYSVDGGTTYPNAIAASTAADNLGYSWTIPDAISTTIRVKVTDVADIEVTDNSAANFTIRGSFTLTAPNGGEVWRVGQAQSLVWTKSGSINEAKLEYSTNGFADELQTTLIVATTPAANLSYAWNIPDSISNSVKIRISDVAGVSLADVSNGNFAIKGTIALTSPNGGESFGVASVQNITWTRTGSFANVKLEYSTNAFSDESQSYLITASAPADPAPSDNAGTYSWTVPDAISTTVKIRVTDANDAATSDVSNNSFTIRGILTITSPNGGEKWIVGTAQLITWDRFGSISNVRLQYTTNGSIFTEIAASSPNTGSYAWTIPNSITTTGKVRIYDANNNTVTDDSDANFKIQAGFTLTSPNGGEAWLVGSTQSIAWNTSGTVAFIRLDYSTDSGANYSNVITSSTGNTGSYDWVIPDTPSPTVRVKVSDTNDSEAFDASNADLRIRVAFTLVTPNGSEQWRVGQSRNITWVNIGNVSNVRLVYSRDGFLADNQTIAAAAPNTGTYAWTIPDSISNTVRIKISDPNDIGASDSSNADFRITGDFTMTSPNGGEKWDVDSNHNITWNYTGSVANATIEYSTNAGGSWTPVVGLTPNNGSYDWQIPDTITAAGRVRVSDPNDATANDISDANFKIRAGYTLTAPNGGQIWTVADTQAITWTNTGTVANAKLSYSTDSGATFPNTIVASTANDGSYDWTVPDSISTNVRVRAGSATDVDAYDDSDANLKIRGKFQITAPNGSESWQIAQNSNITWTTTGTIATVALYYSTDSGATYPNTIIASTANLNTYTWMVPDVPTTNARIKIENTADTTVYDESNANFKIQGFFTLTAPNGGEQWVVNSAHDITWNWGGTIPNAKLTYSTDGGATYPNVINLTAPNGVGGAGSHTYSWTIPDNISSSVRVRIEDPNDSTVGDSSNADFKIIGSLALTSPNGGERWVTYEQHAITWTTNGTIPNIKLTYSHNDFATRTTIVASVANTNTYNWTIPDPGVNNVPKTTKVRVEDVNDQTVYDDSNAAFNIDYYYVTWDIKDLLTNAALSDLTVKQTKNNDENFVQWQETGVTTLPPRVQPTPAGVWGTVFTKTGYGDLVVVVTADRDQSFNLFMETTVIHLWLADSRTSYDPAAKTLTISAWLSRDGSLLAGGALSANFKIYQGGTLKGDFPLDKVLSGATETGYFSKVVDAGPSGLNLQSGVVYTTLCEMPIASGGIFKTPSSFEITAAKTLQEMKDTVDSVLDKPLSQVEASIRTDMTNQLTAQQTAIETKLDTQTNIIQTKLDETKNTVTAAIDEFTEKSSQAVFDIQDSANKASIRIITPEVTKPGKTEIIRVSTVDELLTTPTLEFFCPNGEQIGGVVNTVKTDSPGIYAAEVEFGRDFRCAILNSVTILGRAIIPSADPDAAAVEATAVGAIGLQNADLDTIQGLAAAAASAKKDDSAAETKAAIDRVVNMLAQSDSNVFAAISDLQRKMDALPSMLNKDKAGEAQMRSQMEELVAKLDKFMGKEGFDLRSILKDEIGEGMKGVRNKIDRTMAATAVVKDIIERKVGKSDEPIVQTFYEIG